MTTRPRAERPGVWTGGLRPCGHVSPKMSSSRIKLAKTRAHQHWPSASPNSLDQLKPRHQPAQAAFRRTRVEPLQTEQLLVDDQRQAYNKVAVSWHPATQLIE